MPTIQIANTTKRINSISQTMNSAVSVNVKLKEECSEHDPVFILQGLQKDNKFNYAKWGDRYYWVDKKVFLTNDLMEFHCHLDALATFHNEILGTTAYCSYADRKHWNSLLDDDRLSADIEVTDDEGTGWTELAWPGNFQAGDCTVVITAIGSEGASARMDRYAMSFQTFEDLLVACGQKVASDINGWNVTNFLKNFAARYFLGGNPADNILSAKLIPFCNIGYFGARWNSVTKLSLGPYEIDCPQDTVYCAYGQMVNLGGTLVNGAVQYLTIPYYNVVYSDPDMKPFDFLNYPKYTSLRFQHPAGEIDINSEVLADQGTLVLRSFVDYASGKYTWAIAVKDYAEIGDTDNTDGLGTIIAEGSGDVSIDLTPYLQVAYTNKESDLAIEAAKLGGKLLGTAAGVPGMSLLTEDKEGNTQLNPNIFSNNWNTKGYQNSGNVNITSSYLNSLLLPWKCQFLLKSDMRFPRIFMESGLPEPTKYVQYCNEYGWPCHTRLMLSDVDNGSFVKCEGASFHSTHPTVGATQKDISNINGYLNSGFIKEI